MEHATQRFDQPLRRAAKVASQTLVVLPVRVGVTTLDRAVLQVHKTLVVPVVRQTLVAQVAAVVETPFRSAAKTCLGALMHVRRCKRQACTELFRDCNTRSSNRYQAIIGCAQAAGCTGLDGSIDQTCLNEECSAELEACFGPTAEPMGTPVAKITLMPQ